MSGDFFPLPFFLSLVLLGLISSPKSLSTSTICRVMLESSPSLYLCRCFISWAKNYNWMNMFSVFRRTPFYSGVPPPPHAFCAINHWSFLAEIRVKSLSWWQVPSDIIFLLCNIFCMMHEYYFRDFVLILHKSGLKFSIIQTKQNTPKVT